MKSPDSAKSRRSAKHSSFQLFSSQHFSFTQAPLFPATPISPPSGPPLSFLSGLHLKSNFLAIAVLFIALPSFAQEVSFQEVNPAHSSVAFRKEISAALLSLKNSSNIIAQETYQSLVDGRAKIDEISDLTLEDFKRVLKDYKDDGADIGLTIEQYSQLTQDGSKARNILEQHLAGYQWDDRIYVARGQSLKDLAASLVHELNHVLNRSHLYYYEEEIDAFREEYRAFYVEKAAQDFDISDASLLLKIKKQIIRDYLYAEVTADSISDKPNGYLHPTPVNWSKNR